jgi:hypothetical protein
VRAQAAAAARTNASVIAATAGARRSLGASYLCTSFSSALWIRCTAHHDDHFEHVDGGGKRFAYRILPLPTVDESVVPTIHV